MNMSAISINVGPNPTYCLDKKEERLRKYDSTKYLI